MVKLYVGITDYEWFRYLSSLPSVEEVNFWQPGGRTNFRVLLYVLPLTCAPIILMVAGRGVDNAVGASPHDIRDTIPEAVADVRETRLSTLIFDGIMQKGGDCHVLGAAIFENSRSYGE